MENVKDTRAPRRLVGRLAIAGILGAALATFGFVGTAAADTINYTGQGANRDGTCGEFEGSPPAPGGTQTWQFNLTATDGPATMSATFSDGTSVTNVPDDSPHAGNVSKWFIVTNAGASIVSASATRTTVAVAGGSSPTAQQEENCRLHRPLRGRGAAVLKSVA